MPRSALLLSQGPEASIDTGKLRVSSKTRIGMKAVVRILYQLGGKIIVGDIALQKRVELTVGSKGEIYTTNDVRRAAGIRPGTLVVAEVSEGQVTLRPKVRGEDLLEKPRIDAPPITPKQISKLRKELAAGLARR